jgi:hypothetical protein
VTGSGTQVYGGTPTFSASYSGFVLGEGPSALGGTLSFSTTTTSSSDVGTYTAAVTPGGLTSSNYAISYVKGSMTVTPASLTVTVDNETMVYGSSVPILTGTLSGVVNDDPITVSYSTTATAASPAGSYAITATLNDPNGRLGNYNITYVYGTLTVVPAITAPAALTAYENVSQAVSGISIGTGLSGSVTLTLAVGHGRLTLGSATGLTVTGNGSGTVSLTGSTADLNAALTALAYRGGLNFSGADTLSLTLSVGGISSQASVAITVVSIAQQAANLCGQVDSLYAAGVLNQGQANSLCHKLDLQGNHGDIGKVQAFLNEVQARVRAGILTQALADALLGPGKILLLGLTVEFGG